LFNYFFLKKSFIGFEYMRCRIDISEIGLQNW